MREGLDPAEAHVVSTAVHAVDHRVGFAGQFVMQPGGDEEPDDRRRRRVGVNHLVHRFNETDHMHEDSIFPP
jgi:hypothetical protein